MRRFTMMLSLVVACCIALAAPALAEGVDHRGSFQRDAPQNALEKP